jgi:ketosteroid isomerase-like protein
MADTMTLDAAKRLVQAVEDAFGAADLTAIEQGFTEDVVARFADFPEMRGRERSCASCAPGSPAPRATV